MRADYGIFCDYFGKNLRNLVIEYILIMKELDWSVGDLAEEVDISRPKAYQFVNEMESQGIIKKTRVLAGAQLYCIDTSNPHATLLQETFNNCLRLFAEEYEKKNRKTSRTHIHSQSRLRVKA